jgi:hypothetical protein
MKSSTEITSIDGLWQAHDEATKRFGSRPWFRGQRDIDWKLKPTIFRWLEKQDLTTEQERLAYRRFQARALVRHPGHPDTDDLFGWLTLMRHFDLPTRLLDWTESVLVAAHFAVAGVHKEHGSQRKPAALWLLNPSGLNDQGGAPYTPWHSSVAWRVRRAFANEAEYDPKPYAVVPRETDLRMLVQQSVFTLHGDGTPLEECEDHGSWLMKSTISAAFKPDLHQHLRSLGITQAYLFPDLERLAHDVISPGEYREEGGEEGQAVSGILDG